MKVLLQWILTTSLVAFTFAVGVTAQSPAARSSTLEHGHYFNILDYGARNDGSANAAEAFRAAIAALGKAGGGTVFVPAGHYIVSGSIEMVSNMSLEFDAGSIVQFPAVALPFTPGRQQGIETLTPMPLIGGHDLENVAVVGRGVLVSNNDDWMKLHTRSQATENDPGSANGPNWEQLLNDLNSGKSISEEEYKKAASELRPSFIRFMNSKNILVDGLRFIGSPMWTVHLLYDDNAVVENLVIETYPGVHTDGIVVDSSRFVKLENDYIDTGDDGIVIKSGKDADGLRVNRPAEDVTITNCTVHHAHGAVSIGSETSGSIRNIVASNMTVVDTMNGARIKSSRGRGGVVEDIRFDNWTMRNVGEAIVVTNYYLMEGEVRRPDQTVSKATPIFRNIAMSHMTIDGAKVLIDIDGLPEMPIQGLRISDIVGTGMAGMTANFTDGLELHNVQLNPQAGVGFKVDHATNLELDNVTTKKPLPNVPVIRLENTPGAIVRNSRAFPGTETFLSTRPGELKSIQLQGNVLGNAKTPTEEVDSERGKP